MAIFARTRRSRVSRPSLTAAGTKITRENADSLKRINQPWQSRAFTYYDLCGEAKYAAQFYSRMLAPLRIFAAEIDDNGDPIETTNADAIDALDRIQDPGGGRTSLLGSYGRLMFLIGEALLFVSKDEDGQEQWEMLSPDELKVEGTTYMRFKAPSLNPEQYREASDDDWEPVNDTDAVAYRLWRRHPRYSAWADSTMQAVLDLFEELVLLTQAVRARARSRMAGSGLLFLDDRISPAPPEPVGDEDPDEDLFLTEITEAMMEPIQDEGSASAVVPLLVRVPVPENAKVSDLYAHLQIIDPTQLYPETGLRKECIERIAIGLDMPPEILLGLQDSNHWTAWQIDEQTWKGHGQPIAQQFCDDLTASYFRPYLREQNVADWDRFCIAYDAASVINHPDRTKDAKDLHDRGALSYEALRDAAGFDDDTAPSEEEHNEWLGVKLRDASVALYGIPTIRGGVIEPQPGEVESEQGTSTSPTSNGNGAGPASSEVQKGQPELTPEEQTGLPESSNGQPSEVAASADQAALVARILGASDLALLRSREVAGNRARSFANKDEACRELINGTKATEVCAVLGRENMRMLHAPAELDLVRGARPLIVDAFRLFRVLDNDQIILLVESIEKHAARTLYDARPTPLPPSFTNYVIGLALTAV